MCRVLVLSLLLVIYLNAVVGLGVVIYAVNAGGSKHTDVNGITYQRDPLHGKIGTASSFGMRLILVGRVHKKDEILYQTERYHDDTFGYELPAEVDGNYVLVMKFCEVYFKSSNKKVFDVTLNGQLVVSNLDIFDKVGHGVAHEEIIPYTIKNRKLYVNGEVSDIIGYKIKLEFVKGPEDNPKINAFYVMQGTVEDLPKLTGIEEDMDEDVERDERHLKLVSGPKTPDPYLMDKQSVLIPIFITIGAAIPIFFCLCKL